MIERREIETVVLRILFLFCFLADAVCIPRSFLEISSMTDNINKLSKDLDSNKQQLQQTAASIVNLTDDGEI